MLPPRGFEVPFAVPRCGCESTPAQAKKQSQFLLPHVDNPSDAMLELLATMERLGIYDIYFRTLDIDELSKAPVSDFDAKVGQYAAIEKETP